MHRLEHRVLVLVCVAVLSGCVSSPFEQMDAEVTAFGPADALASPAQSGQQVIWGGQVVAVHNLQGFTELEVVALPLDGADRPKRREEGGIRFVIRHPGFLEPMTYSPGRFVTALGVFDSIERRTVGEFMTDQPVLSSQRVELWPIYQESPMDHFRIGVGIRF